VIPTDQDVAVELRALLDEVAEKARTLTQRGWSVRLHIGEDWDDLEPSKVWQSVRVVIDRTVSL
jgi:hypothetical protein